MKIRENWKVLKINSIFFRYAITDEEQKERGELFKVSFLLAVVVDWWQWEINNAPLHFIAS